MEHEMVAAPTRKFIPTEIVPGCGESLRPGPALAPTAPHPRVLRCNVNCPQRKGLEQFVSHKFRNQHDVTRVSFLPSLLGLKDISGNILAAVGYGSCTDKPTLLEQYLDAPIDEHIALLSGTAIQRHEIVEIGNLAADNSYWASLLFSHLAEDLSQQGYRWAAFTATRQVRRIFTAMGVSLTELAGADPDRLGMTAQNWGNYYQNAPRVVVGNIHPAMSKLMPSGIDRSGKAQ
jgi:hypothetical protein